MSLIKENTDDAVRERDDVLFSIVIPAGSLSLKDYVKGGHAIFVREPKCFPSRTRLVIIGVIIGIVLLVGTQWLSSYSDLQLIVAGWRASTDETALLFLYLFFFGWISAAVWIRRRSYKFYQIRYRATNSINAGYRLELMARGIRFASLTDDGVQAWQNFTGWGNVIDVIHGERVDFIVLQSGVFLWVPKTLEESLRGEVITFIKQKIVEAAKGEDL